MSVWAMTERFVGNFQAMSWTSLSSNDRGWIKESASRGSGKEPLYFIWAI